ncbi:hypothetical protein P618_200678 [Holospora obtusa F1]|uniref:Insertion element IS402-like domain-containing protein n=1 Tax=Holospora obtusa F1 TaxID=1399147 RepID=W6TGT5_HOLOB|nr:hypothetical protein P618_200678 [Holospora obtusa F1]
MQLFHECIGIICQKSIVTTIFQTAYGVVLEPHLPGREGVWGGRAQDNCQCINAIFWILRTGAPWPDYGSWSSAHRRFIRWRDKGIREKLLEE